MHPRQMGFLSRGACELWRNDGLRLAVRRSGPGPHLSKLQLACDVLAVCEHPFQRVLYLPKQSLSLRRLVAVCLQPAHNLTLAGHPSLGH